MTVFLVLDNKFTNRFTAEKKKTLNGCGGKYSFYIVSEKKLH